MGDMADTPRPTFRWRGKDLLLRGVLVGVILFLVSVSWGVVVPVGKVAGLHVVVDYEGHVDVSPEGALIYDREQPMSYQVQIENRSGSSLSDLEIQSSLHSNGTVCGEKTYEPGVRLPGAPFSPVYHTSLPAGEKYSYRVIYDPKICGSEGHLKVHLRYSEYGRPTGSTLISPATFRFQ